MPSASAASPRPAIASRSCHMISGFSGLPKFRQLVSASGRAPVQATLRAASATAAIVPPARVEPAEARVAVDGERQRLARGRAVLALHAHERGVAARAEDGVALHELVVLAPDPGLRAEVRVVEERRAARAPGSSSGATLARSSFWRSRSVGRLARRPVELRGARGHRVDRDVDHRLAVRSARACGRRRSRARRRPRRGPSARNTSQTASSRPARATSSMRSWLSESSSS